MAKYRGTLAVTTQLIEALLQLPNGTEILDMSYEKERGILQIALRSDEAVDELTFLIPEGGVIPNGTWNGLKKGGF